MMARTSGSVTRLLYWCSMVTILFGCISTFTIGGFAASVPDGKEEANYKLADRLYSFTDAAQTAYTAALAEAAIRYSKAMSAVSAQISGEPEPVQGAAFASVSSAYFSAIAAAQQAVQGARTNIVPEATPTPTADSLDWTTVLSLAQKNLDDSVSWAHAQYEQAKVAIGAAEATPTTPSKQAQNMLEQAKFNYYAGLGVAHDRYNEFLALASAAASSWKATATPTATPNLAEKAEQNWDRLVAQVSNKVYGAPTPTPAWYANYYSQATQAPAAVQSIVSELLVGKEPTYRESVLAQLAAAYSQATATVSSVYTEATQAVDDVFEGAAQALGNAGKIALEQISEMKDKAKDTIGERKEWIKDEL
jgi:hypothetical protein